MDQKSSSEVFEFCESKVWGLGRCCALMPDNAQPYMGLLNTESEITKSLEVFLLDNIQCYLEHGNIIATITNCCCQVAWVTF